MSAARTERLLNLLTLLLNTRRPISLREIREMDEFSAYRTGDPRSGERAFERDKAALLELGVPLRWVAPESDSDDEGQGGYVIDRERYFLPDLHLKPSDLALLSIAGAAVLGVDGFFARGAVLRALAKLGFDVDGEGAIPGLAYTPSVPGVDPQRIASHLEVLHHAVAHRQSVDLTYGDMLGESTVRRVDPYGMYYRRGIWYLVGYCHLRGADRTFHLGRIESIHVRDPRKQHQFQLPPSFRLRDHIDRRPWEFPGDTPCDVVIRLAARLVPAISEIFGPHVHVVRDASGTFVHLRVTHQAALIATVLPYGAAAEVLTPLSLRQQIGQAYRQLAQHYSTKSPLGRAIKGSTTESITPSTPNQRSTDEHA